MRGIYEIPDGLGKVDKAVNVVVDLPLLVLVRAEVLSVHLLVRNLQRIVFFFFLHIL